MEENDQELKMIRSIFKIDNWIRKNKSNNDLKIYRSNDNHVTIIIVGKKEKDESLNHLKTLNSYSLGAKIIYETEKICVLEYIKGKNLSNEELHQHSKKILELLSRWHSVPCKGKPNIFNKIVSMLENLNMHKLPMFKDLVSTLCNIKCVVERGFFPVALCHGNISPSTILLKANGDVAFIDYEHACVNYRGFDIAGFLCSFIGDESNIENIPKKERFEEYFGIYGKGIDWDEVKIFIPLALIYSGILFFAEDDEVKQNLGIKKISEGIKYWEKNVLS